MKTSRKFGKLFLSIYSAAALVFLGGMPQAVDASEPIYYEGTSALCAVSLNMFDPPNTQGNNGVYYMDDLTMVWQHKSPDTPLMNGRELMHTDWKQTKSGVTFQTGRLVNIPDIYAGTGTFEEKFKFKVDGSPISGVFTGTGALEGVTATYVLVDALYTCDPEVDWLSLCPHCVPFPAPVGYDMSGWIEGYDPE